MKKPTLRLRQVFENPTHFKVQRPLGNPVTIAKKGLSPGMVRRLQKLAHGGEVRNYQAGGEIVDEAQPVPVVVPPAEVTAPVVDDLPLALAPPPAVPVAPPVVAPVAAVAPVAPAPALAVSTADARVESAAQTVYGRPFGLLSSAERASVTESLKPPPAPSIAAPPLVDIDKDLPLATKPLTAKETAENQLFGARSALSRLAEMPEPTTEAEKLEREGQRALAMETVRAAEERVAELGRAELLDVESKRLQAQVAAQEARIAKDREFLDNAEKELAENKNIGSYFSRLDTWSRLTTAASLALGSIAASLTGGPNQAMKIYENAIEADLEKQRRDQQSLLNRIVRTGARIDQAEEVVRALGQRAMAAKLDSASATVASTKAKEGLAQLAFGFRSQAFDRIERMKQAEKANAIAQSQLRLEQRRVGLLASAEARRDVELALEAEKLRQAGAKLGVEAEERKTEEQRKKEERSFTVAGVQLLANNPAQARKAEEQILGQTDFVAGARRALDVFKENPRMVYVKYTDANSKAKLALAQMLERYPKSERFGRPLNVTASKVIKTGLPSVEDIFDGVLGNPQLVLRELIDDVEHQRKLAIETYGGRSPEEARRAISELKKRETPIRKIIED